MSRTFILELSEQSVRLMAQLVHLYQVNEPKRENGGVLLDELVAQTDVVFRNPRQHSVFSDPLMASASAKRFEAVYYIPSGQ